MRFPLCFAVSAGTLLSLISQAASAQQVTFATQISVPTLGTTALLLSAVLLALVAAWLMRKRSVISRVLTLAAMAGMGAYLASQQDFIGQAWATIITPEPINATQSPVQITPTAQYDQYWSITNATGSPIVITALVNGGTCAESYYYVVTGYDGGPTLPACAPSLTVSPGKACGVRTVCSSSA